MRIIALSALRIFWESQPGYRDAKTPLVELYRHNAETV
jgi:mRNA interferase HigB